LSKSRSVIVGLFFITLVALFLNVGGAALDSSADTAEAESGKEAPPRIEVTLSAAQWTTSYDARDPGRATFDLPLLYLHRQRQGSVEADRTLAIGIAGLAGGTEIEVEVVSLHTHVSTGRRQNDARRFVLPDRRCTSDDPCTVQWTFDPATTLSDLYTLRVRDSAGRLRWKNPHPDQPDLAMLDTWDVGLDGYTVRVVYATLFPFARGQNDLDNRLPPGAVTDFVEHQFVPMIVDTWNTQFHTWRFAPIHPNWDSDRVVEVIITDPPFALFDGTGSYTRLIGRDGLPYPERRIWWPSSNNAFQAYDALENGCKVVFSHEFFHLVQWNVLVSTGHPESFWLHVFIEGQGKFAPSAQYPELEIHREHLVVAHSAYTSAANRFLALRLNTSYRDIEANDDIKYDATLYWRFLYEQYGDMAIIRASIEEMARHFDSEDVVGSMERAMDAAFGRFDGPFYAFEESITAFAQANYALRLGNGRRRSSDPAECGELYCDPDDAYMGPPLEAKLYYDGSRLTYDGAIPASYGMDFIEVSLYPTVRNRPVVITFQRKGTVAQFDIQVWKLGSRGAKPHPVTPRPEAVPQSRGEGGVYRIPGLDTTAYNRLAIIITRLDADETTDPAGGYHITMESTARRPLCMQSLGQQRPGAFWIGSRV
jgi:hypothetical protein